MAVRIRLGPDGSKAILLGQDGAPLDAGDSGGDGQDALPNLLAAAMANAALASGSTPKSLTFSALMAREIDALRGSALAVWEGETGTHFLRRLGVVPSAAQQYATDLYRVATGVASLSGDEKLKAGYLSQALEGNELAKPFRVPAPPKLS